MKTLTLLHFADLHLGSPMGNISDSLAARLRSDQKNFLRSLPGLCAEQGAEILLIAGDLFDNPYPPQDLANFVADCLAALRGVDVYITPGNHDPLTPDSVWERTRWPDHVHIFTEDTQRFVNEAKNVCIDGAAYTSYYADEPLFILDPPSDSGYRILMWHGDITTSDSRYNPLHPTSPHFQNYDYIALGHVHNPPVTPQLPAYPGFVLGRGFDEPGAGGVSVVTVSRENTRSRVLPVANTRFEIVEANISGAETDDEAMEKIEMALASKAGEREVLHWISGTVLRLVLTGAVSEDAALNQSILESRLLLLKPLDVQLRDHTYTAMDLSAVAKESGLRGLMARNILERKTRGENPKRLRRAFDLLLRAERKEPLEYED